LKGRKAIGGASLINPQVLVTAAHILEEKQPEEAKREFKKIKYGQLKVRCGEYDLRSSDIERYPHQDRDVASYTFHPFYSGQGKKTTIKLANDIAVIHVKEEFDITVANVNPICLPSFDKPTINSLCHSMGWGIKSQEDFEETNIMKQVRLNEVTPREDCKQQILDSEAVPKVWQLDDSWICATAYKNQSENNVLCKGDGGGPLVCEESGGEIGKERYVLSGIIAYGIGSCNTDIPDVFASVHDALCFIDYDVKCKHGKKFETHFDYQSNCGNWFDEQYAARDDPDALSGIRRELFYLNKLKKSCRDIPDVDPDECFIP